MRHILSIVVVSAVALPATLAQANPPMAARAVVEPGSTGAALPTDLHAFLIESWRSAQPVPPSLRGLLGPALSIAPVSVFLAMPAPAALPAAALAGHSDPVGPVPSDELVAVGLRSARARAALVLDEALDNSRLWALEAPLSALTGALPSPVASPVETPYGPARFDGAFTTLRHPGLTFAADPGGRVVAIGRGIVRYSAELNGYGQVVIMDHGAGYYSVYACLSRVDVDVGALVEANETIGALRADPEGAQLYFELRHHDVALDPTDWIRTAP